MGLIGVVTDEDSAEEASFGFLKSLARCCIASSAASLNEMAEPFFFNVDLNANLDFGARAFRVLSSF